MIFRFLLNELFFQKTIELSQSIQIKIHRTLFSIYQFINRLIYSYDDDDDYYYHSYQQTRIKTSDVAILQ
jgi:hypothetical protein